MVVAKHDNMQRLLVLLQQNVSLGCSLLPPFYLLQASQVREIQPGLCSYPRSPSYALGVTAALSLLVAQIVINVASGCICCRKNPYTSTTHWTLALVCFIISWYTFSNLNFLSISLWSLIFVLLNHLGFFIYLKLQNVCNRVNQDKLSVITRENVTYIRPPKPYAAQEPLKYELLIFIVRGLKLEVN